MKDQLSGQLKILIVSYTVGVFSKLAHYSLQTILSQK